ncbi:MAG TPA: ABC transporter permease [archaeon]|nr:ABC transporter permease [archaeon]
MILKLFSIALKNVSHRKARSLLTITGITIGIAAVVALITIGNSLTFAVSDQLEKLGSDKVIVSPKMTRSFGPPVGSAGQLTEQDLDAIRRLKSVDIAIPILIKSIPIDFKGAKATVTVTGVPTSQASRFFSDVQNYEIQEGRFMREGERSAAVIGGRISEDLFDGKLKLRNKIVILNKDVSVVGVLKPVGSQQDDTSVIMSIEALRDITGNGKEISFIFTKVFGDPEKAAEEIQDKLASIHREDLFVAITSKQLISQINGVFGVMSIVLSGIAGISLLVAAFGIMNTMLMSVMERTREIGTLKAVGARNSHIIMLFLIESAMVGTLGGVAGTAIGFATTAGIAGAAQNLVGITMKVQLDYALMLFAVLFAAAIGIASGTYPAYKAAKLNPVEALRYE